MDREAIRTIEATERVMGWDIYGEVAPGGAWIAYQTNAQEETLLGNTLEIMRGDGSEQRIIAHGLTSGGVKGFHRFAWSSDGQSLAFIRHWSDPTTHTFGQEISIYQPALNHDPQQVLRLGNADLVGWRDPTTILLLAKPDPQTPRSLLALNVQTQRLTPLSPLATTTTDLAPDRTALLVSIDGNPQLFDLVTNTFISFAPTGTDLNPAAAVWSADSKKLLISPTDRSQPAFLFSREGTPLATIHLIPPTTPFSGFYNPTASPDGNYLIVCERSGTAAQTYLYDIPNDQWSGISETGCGSVFGWQ